MVKDSSNETITGGIAYDASNGQLLSIKAKGVIIAAGGLSTLFFPKTDTMRGNTGDSYAVGIRAGAALVVTGLAADGETAISNAHHVDRGYEDLAGKLSSVGAQVTRT